ncbi:MAG: F0F1 ATP synthase subunit delta [Rhodobacterales bacterium]|nr:F0F1 ATP synthase subunit delta [Rhodobacterales bacterium]
MSSATTGATGLSGRYATALFELAEESGDLDRAADDLGRLDAMISESEDLRRMLRSPVMSRKDQAAAMTALMDQADLSDLTKRFVGLVTSNRRLFVLPDIIAAFRGMLAARRGETTAEVVSAKELSETQLQAVRDALKAALKTDVSVDARVDADLLGGLIVKVGSRMVDSSLRSKLQRLSLSMKGIG